MDKNNIPLPDLVASALKSLRGRNVAAVLVYGYQEAGRAVMKMTSNVGQAATEACLTWLRGNDFESAGKALHETTVNGRCVVCSALGPQPASARWEDLMARERNEHIVLAKVAIAGVHKARIVDPNAPPVV